MWKRDDAVKPAAQSAKTQTASIGGPKPMANDPIPSSPAVGEVQTTPTPPYVVVWKKQRDSMADQLAENMKRQDAIVAHEVSGPLARQQKADLLAALGKEHTLFDALWKHYDELVEAYELDLRERRKLDQLASGFQMASNGTSKPPKS